MNPKDHHWIALIPIPMMVIRNEDGQWGWHPLIDGFMDLTEYAVIENIVCIDCKERVTEAFGTPCLS